MNNSTISFLVEIPEELYNIFMEFLNTHPNWDADRAYTSAISLFILQNLKKNDRRISKFYLDSLFKRTIGS